MKKLNLLIIIGLVALITSCSYWIAPPFTNVERIAKIKPGMSIDEVNNTLGISPYNIFHIQDDGGSVITYKYRLKNRRMTVPARMKRQMEVRASEEAQTLGTTWYDNQEHTIYVLFNNLKVKSLISDEGLSKSEFILLKDNNLRIITKKEFNSLRKLGNKPASNLLILNEKNVIQSIDLPKEKSDESNTVIIEENNDNQTKTQSFKNNIGKNKK